MTGQPTRLHVVLDRHLCRGYANCVAAAPEVFDMDDEGLAYLLQEEVDAGLTEALQRAARLCPTGAITVTHRD